MEPWPPEEERKIVDALTDFAATGWMSTLQESFDLIRGQCSCSLERAEQILEDLYVRRRLIVLVSKYSVTPDDPQKTFSYKWRRPTNE